MSFKGIAWAGNIYEKFEAMCLEVEEAMYQDTVKYVENQVQKVGVSVKKFYSEVMDDLHPVSCVDPKSLASHDSPFTDVNKKPKPTILLENEDQVIPNVTVEKGSLLSGYDVNLFSPQSPGIFIENKSSEKCAANKKIGVHRRPIGIKRISRNNHPSNESSRDTSVSEDGISKTANCDINNSRLASDDTDVTSSSNINVRCEPAEALKGNTPVLDRFIDSPASNETLSPESAVKQDASGVACDDTYGTSSLGIVMCGSEASLKENPPKNLIQSYTSKKLSSAEPVGQIKDDTDCISPASDNGLLAKSIRLIDDPDSTSSCCGSPTESSGPNITSKVCNLEYEEKVALPDNVGSSMKDGSSSASPPPCITESCNKNFITSRGILKMDDASDIEFVENEGVTLENFETREIVKLDESCVLVEGDELHYAIHRTRKHKSYKKRIREALSLKIKSRKDGEVVSQHSGGKMVGGIESEQQKLSAHDSVESDWELL